MKVFVWEHCCAQPLDSGGQTEALRAEGFAMLASVMADLGQLRGVEAVALVARDLAGATFPCRRAGPTTEKRHFRALAASSDWTLVIAPEFDGILEQRCRAVLHAGGRLLGPTPEAVRLTGDKRLLSDHFEAHGVPTIPARLLDEPLPAFPLVLKPRFGAGALATHLVKDARELTRVRRLTGDRPMLAQAFHSGTAASVALLIGPGVGLPLLPAGQSITTTAGELGYAGGWAPLTASLRRRAVRLARRAAGSVSGLFGYVGVDLILGASVMRDVVLEINPRLTTSYLGLRLLCRANLTGALLEVVRGDRPTLAWHRNRVVRWDCTTGAIPAQFD